MRYKIILKTSSVNIHRVKLCVDTWLKDQDYVCLTDILTGKYPEISGSQRTDYYSAEEKTSTLINLVKDTNQFDDYDWLVFIDDDAILNIKMFNFIIEFLNKNCVYGLKMHGGVYPQQPHIVFPSGGAGYFISPELIKKVQPMINNNWGPEDVSVGQWILLNDIPFEDHFKIGNKKYYLKLNGWFPFEKEKKIANINYLNDVQDSLKVLSAIQNTEETCNFLLSCMTHHYIRFHPFMSYIHSCFQTWESNTHLDLNRVG
jgi:hypothetical protein